MSHLSQRKRGWMRSAAIYAVLAILPSTSLAWLGFANLESARTERLRAQRAQAASALEAISSDLERQVELRLERERDRPFYEYEAYYRPLDGISSIANYVPNPLADTADPVVRARWQVPRKPGALALEPGALRILPLDDACRDRVQDHWLATITTEASRPLAADRSNVTGCVLMPQEVMAANRLQGELRARVERAQLGASEDNAYLGEAEQAWRNSPSSGAPAVVASYHTDLGQRLLARGATVELLSLREVSLPSIAANEVIGALSAERVLQGVVLDLRILFEEGVSRVRRYLEEEGVRIELGDDAGAAEPALQRSLAEMLAALPVAGPSVLFARLDPAAIERGVAEQRRSLRWLLGALAAAIAVTSVFAFRALRREWRLLERQRAFVSAVTHELRTPVAGIRLYADLLQEGWVSGEEQRQSFFATLRGEANRLERLVDDVLHVAAFDRAEPRVQPELRDEPLAPLVQQLAEEFRRAPRERAFQLELGALDPGVARLDRESLRRILFNLLENAVKYTPAEREPRVLVRVRDLEGELAIEVEDNACGIRPEERAAIFEDFYRIGDESRRAARGAGLGLGVVRRHVEALAGRIEVESEIGVGSTFRVLLPRRRARES